MNDRCLTVSVNGLNFQVRQRPGGSRPLVLVHGLSDSSTCWETVMAALDGAFAVTAYDLRGHGLSDAPASGYSPADHAQDLLGLLDALSLSNPLVVGHSLGAETAAVAASLAPGRIARIVLEDPPWIPSWIHETEVERRASIHDWKNDVQYLQSLSEAEAWLKARRDNTNWPDSELRPWLESKRQMRLVAFESAVAPRGPWQNVVDCLTCPTLLLSGDVAKWGLVSPAVGREATERNPNVKWIQILEAGHGIHRDCFETYLTLVTQFLNETA